MDEKARQEDGKFVINKILVAERFYSDLADAIWRKRTKQTELFNRLFIFRHNSVLGAATREEELCFRRARTVCPKHIQCAQIIGFVRERFHLPGYSVECLRCEVSNYVGLHLRYRFRD